MEMAFKLVELHLQSEHKLEIGKPEKGGGAKNKMDKIRRPEVGPDMSNDKWAYFLTRWETYKTACGLKDDDVTGQLMECMLEGVREDHYRQFGGAKVESGEVLLEQVKQVAVPKSNRAVQRDSLNSVRQERGEGVRKFCGRIRAVALVCEYEVECGCSKKNSYMDCVIKDKVIAGLGDGEIKTEVLSHREVNKWTLKELLAYIESKEAGKKSATVMGGSGTVSGVFKKREDKKKPGKRKPQAGGCDNCGRSHGKDGVCPAKDRQCFNCEKTGHLAFKCRQPKKEKNKVKKVDVEEKKDTVGAVVDDHWIGGVNVSDNIYEN